MDLLKDLSELNDSIKALEQRRADLLAAIEQAVLENGDMKGYGYEATIAPGRKTTDHEAAARAAAVPQALVDKYTTVKPTIAWAKVTKEAKADIAPFTTTGDPVFTVKVAK